MLVMLWFPWQVGAQAITSTPHIKSGPALENFSGAVAKSEHPCELCRTIAALLKAHLPSKFSLEPPDDKPLGPKQTKKSQALLPEFHRIV